MQITIEFSQTLEVRLNELLTVIQAKQCFIVCNKLKGVTKNAGACVVIPYQVHSVKTHWNCEDEGSCIYGGLG